MIQVLEVYGTVSVERQTMGTMDAYEGMRLESGDKITVGTDSWLKIKMDEDKYALLEPNSVLQLEASGSSADSKTVLHLEAGAVSNRLEKELSPDSSYEVNTPNSTMAVRGTVFRVEISWSEDGVSVSDISVYDGEVASRLIYPDGTMDGEGRAVLIVTGTEAQVWGNDILSRYVTTESKLELNDLRLKTLEFLREAQEAGQELHVSHEELEGLITALEQEPEPSEKAAEPAAETTAPTEETTAPTEETTVPTTVPVRPRPTTPPEDEEEDPPATTQAPETEAPAPIEYTVTFKYGETAFATQTVPANGTAQKPTLQPTASGAWSLDFAAPITQDTVVVWNAG